MRALSLGRLALVLSLLSVPAAAQVDQAPQPIDIEPSSGPDDAVDEGPQQVPDDAEEPPDEVGTHKRPSDNPVKPASAIVPSSGAADAGTPAADAGTAEAAAAIPSGVDPRRAPPKPILIPHQTDADLVATWQKWRQAQRELDPNAAEAAEAELIRMKEDLGIEDLDEFAVGFVRAAEAKQKASDPAGAVALAEAAVQLAPDLPLTHLALAHARLDAQMTDAGGYASEIRAAALAVLRDPRYLRPAFADLAATVVFSLLATAGAVTLMLFLRRARYFLHDFRHLFPRATAQWQSAVIALLLVGLPVLLRLGVAPVLLAMFAAVALYLSVFERLVAAVLIAAIAPLPLLAGLAIQHAAFAGTAAEDVQALEVGGLSAAPAAERVKRHLAGGSATFPELFALGRYELRRGQLDAAVDHFKQAAAQRSAEPRLLTNLANAMMAQGDPEGALDLYKSATQADPALAAAFFDLSRLYNRRAQVLSDELVGAELDRSQTAVAAAQRLDESLLFRKDPPEDNLLHNRLLISPRLSPSEIAELGRDPQRAGEVAAQLSLAISGTASSPLAFVYPGVLAALVFLLGSAAQRLGASRCCDRCGRAVCRRCDPELGMGSLLCGQCVNVFARKGNAVPAPVKVRKQIEVDRYRARSNRLSYAFGLVCSGAGHLFSGVPVRGALYAFAFLFVVSNAFFRFGVLRPVYGALPPYLRLAPLGICLAAVYLLSLRGLHQRQSEE